MEKNRAKNLQKDLCMGSGSDSYSHLSPDVNYMAEFLFYVH